MAVAEDKILPLIEEVYAAAIGEVPWDGVAAHFANAFEASACSLRLWNPLTGAVTALSRTKNHTPAAIHSYVERYWKVDEYVRLENQHLNRVHSSGDTIRGTRLIDTEIDNYYVLGTVISLAGSHLGTLGIHRARVDRPFDEPRKQGLQIIVPHLRRAFQMHAAVKRNEMEKKIGLEALDRLSLGVALLEADCRIYFCNNFAERLLNEKTAILVRQGKFTAIDRAAADQITRHVRDAASWFTRRSRDFECGLLIGDGATERQIAISVPLPAGGRISMLICPLRAEWVALRPVQPLAIAFITDSRKTQVRSGRILTELYGFSAAELRLALALIAGDTVQEFAVRAGVSINTVKTQLRALFLKTGTSRQSELLRLLASNPIAAFGDLTAPLALQG